MNDRIGVLGGMFDPVHSGHVAIARHALKLLKLDRLKLVPCYQPGHRSPACEQASHRLAMLELATVDDVAIEVDDCEVQRGGTSYMVDTLVGVQKQETCRHLVLVLGMDAMNTLTSWHRWSELLKICHLLVMARNGQDLDPTIAMQTDWNRRLAPSAEELFSEGVGRVLLSTQTRCLASSTRFRKALRAGNSVSAMVPDKVLAYIRKHKLYSSVEV